MGYTNVDLKGKIVEMYPEIGMHGISVSLDFSKEKDAYIVKFKKGGHELTTHLEKKGRRRMYERHQVRLSRRPDRPVR